ncbi:MAG TPA: hypothetical protein VNC22_10950 [Sporichthya sp.]|nr:hypothetical protein [Sporichthya sp.]
MTTSLASSPVLPIAAAAVAGLLIFGTLSSASNASTDDTAGGLPAPEAPPAVDQPAVPANVAPGTAVCKANICTITFPAEGGSVTALGTTITATKFYKDGITVTVAGTPLVTNLTTPAKGAGFTVKAVSVKSGAAGPHVVKVTKNK